MKIPFVDLRAQYRAHKQEIDQAIQSVIDATAFIGGKPVRAFEDAFSRAYGVAHCVGVGNGTDAIYVAMKMLGIGAGDEVITTACTWIATAETITQCGARPVFVDVDEFFNIDVRAVEAAITTKTRAVIPVHLYGQAAQVDVLSALCQSRGIRLIEDCAQAHFAERLGRRVGTIGDVATFSFYPGKNLGAYGDAGAIITNDEALARNCRTYANHGSLVKHQHLIEGINSRLDGIQAAILSAKLPHILAWTRARVRVAQWYDEKLAGVNQLIRPAVRDGSTHVYHLYVVRVAERDGLREHLTSCGVETGVHYPTPLPFLEAYRYLGHAPGDFPLSERNQAEILSLPIYPEMTEEMVDYVVACIGSFMNR